MSTDFDRDLIIEAAREVRGRAHAPYSGYFVGSAIIDEQGRLHVGCNVENSSFPEGACAETNAIGAMIAAGGQRIVAIAALGGRDNLEDCAPCGGCRQRILEFADDDTRIVLMNEDGEFVDFGIDDLLPSSFRLED